MALELKSVYELVREAEQDYISGTTTLSKYVDFSQYENIEKIEAYVNAKHISGPEDSMGREKPFFDIVTAACNIWYRATDIGSVLRIRPTKVRDTVPCFVATIHVQEWARKNNFSMFTSKWGKTLAKFGSAVVKAVERDGELCLEVVPWTRIISDTVDFQNNPKIEKLFYTPSQLRKMKMYDQKVVEELIEARAPRETAGRERKDNKDDYIEVYELHGELPLSYLTEKEEDDTVYRQQMHVVCFLASRKGRRTEYQDFSLYKGKEAKDPYMITHLLEEDGRAQAIGAVEHLFEAQWMMNHTAKQIKDQLDLASKLIFQTSDGNYVGRNVLTSIENGDILIHNPNEPLTHLQNNSHDISALQSFAGQWKALGSEVNNISESLMGQNPPSGTAWRQTQALLQESHSLFEVMKDNKKMYLEKMVREFLIPYIKKQMDSSEEIAATLDEHGLAQFDSMYVPSEAVKRSNERIKRQILSGQIANELDMQEMEAEVKKSLAPFGATRFIKPSDIASKTWKQFLKDIEWSVEVDVISRNADKEAALTTLTTVLQTVAGNPMILQDPNARLIFNKILNITGQISPIEITVPEAQPAQPAQGPVPQVVKSPAQGAQPQLIPAR